MKQFAHTKELGATPRRILSSKISSTCFFLLACNGVRAFVPSSQVRPIATFNLRQASSPGQTIVPLQSVVGALHVGLSDDEKTEEREPLSSQPTPVLWKLAKEYLPDPQGKASLSSTAAAVALAAAVSLSVALPADAAMSGGRVGGSFSPSRSSGGGGMTRSYGGGGSYNRGYSQGSGVYRGGPTIIAPYIAPPIITPFVSPFGYGVPFGGGVGAISYSRGPGLFDLLFLGAFGWIAVSAVSGALSGAVRNANPWGDTASFASSTSSALGSGTSVLRLNVALDVPNRDDPNSLLSALDRLASTAKTDTRKGVQNLVSQVAVEILRRKSFIQSAASSYKHVKTETEAQRTFNSWSVKERAKFEQETISKFGGIDTSSYTGGRDSAAGDGKATMAVVTLVLSIQGDSTKIPKIQSIADVEEALRRIAADAKVEDCLNGAEILWTPQDRNEVLSRKDVFADYPELTIV